MQLPTRPQWRDVASLPTDGAGRRMHIYRTVKGSYRVRLKNHVLDRKRYTEVSGRFATEYLAAIALADYFRRTYGPDWPTNYEKMRFDNAKRYIIVAAGPDEWALYVRPRGRTVRLMCPHFDGYFESSESARNFLRNYWLPRNFPAGWRGLTPFDDEARRAVRAKHAFKVKRTRNRRFRRF